MSLEKFINGITIHIAKNKKVNQGLVLDIISDFNSLRDEFLVKQGYHIQIEDVGDFILEPPVFDLIVDVSKERDYYKNLCIANDINVDY